MAEPTHLLARAVVVPCQGPGRHRVRLARRRFWGRARCPRCRAPIDPARWRRVLAWFWLLRQPASSDLRHRLVWVGSLAFLAAAVACAVLLRGFSDVWWPATVLLFGPRWVLLLPLVILVPAALWWDRMLALPLVVALLILVGPVMGFTTPWRAWLSGSAEAGVEVGAVTFNARGGNNLALTAVEMLREWRADVAAFQECTGTLRSELRALTPDDGWYTDARASLCIASRHPIVDAQQMDREDFQFAGGSGLVVTWTLALGSTDTVHVTNVHLETPRAGLAYIRRGRLRMGASRTNETSFLRTLELDRARRWAFLFNGPHLVMGDFNTPVESRAYQRAWGDWRNAFSWAGLGLGGTRLNGWIRARIDHVLVNDAWQVVQASPERDLGSDHLPMRAVLVLVRRGGLAEMR